MFKKSSKKIAALFSLYQMFCLDMFLPISVADLLQNKSVTANETLKILSIFNVIFKFFYLRQNIIHFFPDLSCFCEVFNNGLPGRMM